jgi:hypothetical protein
MQVIHNHTRTASRSTKKQNESEITPRVTCFFHRVCSASRSDLCVSILAGLQQKDTERIRVLRTSVDAPWNPMGPKSAQL